MLRYSVGLGLLSAVLACGPSAAVVDEVLNEASSPVAEQRLDARPVRLRYAFAREVCPTCSNWNGVIDIANWGSHKQVTVLWSREGTWFETPARHLAQLDGGREFWAFSGVGGSVLTKMAIRYRVDGREYWDNNEGVDYTAATESTASFGRVGTLAPMGVGIDVATTRVAASLPARGQAGNGLTIDVLVRNRAPVKEVSVVYSVDQWRTSQKAPLNFAYATYSGAGSGESWSGAFSFGAASRVEFAVVAKQGGRESWDNNFGRNYECHLEGASFVCSGLTTLP